MSEPKPVEVAEKLAKEIFARLVIPTFAEFDSRMKAFAAVAFEVPASRRRMVSSSNAGKSTG